MDKELARYLKLFNNYERRFKSITILVPEDLYNKYQYIIEERASNTGFKKIGEKLGVVLFNNEK